MPSNFTTGLNGRARRALAAAIVAASALAHVAPAARAQQQPPVEVSTPIAGSKPIHRDGKPATGFATPGSSTRPAAAPSTSSSSSATVDVGRMLAALAIVLALIGLAYWLARRVFGGGRGLPSTRAVTVLGRTPLGPRQQVVLLQVGRRIVVVGDHAGAMTALAQIEDADEVAALLGQLEGESMRRAASTFGNVFGRQQRSFDADDALKSPGELPPTRDDVPAATDDESLPGELAGQRSELAGLLEKVRSLRGQIEK